MSKLAKAARASNFRFEDRQWASQYLKKIGLSPRRYLDDDDVAGILAEMEGALRGRRTSRQGGRSQLPPSWRALQRFRSPELDAVEAKMHAMLDAVTPGIDARQTPKLRGEWALGERAERELRSSAEWKALEAGRARAIESLRARAAEWSYSIASVDKEKLKRDLNTRIYSSNLFLALYVGLPYHKRLKELEKALGAIEKARKYLNGIGGLRHALALEVDKYPGRQLHAPALEGWPAKFAAYLPPMGARHLKEGAFAQVHQAFTAIDLLADWMKQLAASMEKQKPQERRRSPREKRPDYGRYVLILGLGMDYELAFGQAAALTRDGPCCRFMAAVLSRCEDKKINLSGAWDSWQDARAWEGPPETP